MADSAEQKKKDKRVAARKKLADEKKRKAEKAKRPQGFEGGKAAPKDRGPSVYQGEREIHDREYNPNYGLFGAGGTRTKRSWAGLPGRKTDVENVKGGKYRGADWPAISTYGAEQRARKNPKRGAHRGQSVGAQGEFSHGGSVDTTSPENEDYFARMTQKVYTSDKDK